MARPLVSNRSGDAAVAFAFVRPFAALVVALFLLASLSSCKRYHGPQLAPGEVPPQFSLATLAGDRLSLAELKGSVVLVNFWATWCGPCMSEVPALEHLYGRLKGEGLKIVSVAVDDTPDALLRFKQQSGISFPILLDPTGEVKALYGISGVPESFIVGKDGTLVLFPDTGGSGLPVTRITGPREWDSPEVVAQLRRLLAQ